MGPEGPQLCERRQSLPDLAFTIAGHVFNISAFDYTWKFEGVCFPLFRTDESRENEPLRIVLGSPFLMRWYTVYNGENLTVSLAESNQET